MRCKSNLSNNVANFQSLPSNLIPSITRLAVFIRTFKSDDYTWAVGTLTLWADVEAGLYMISACLPTLSPLIFIIIRHPRFKKLSPRRRASLSTLEGHKGLADRPSQSVNGHNRLMDGRGKNTLVERDNAVVQMLQHQERTSIREEDIELGQAVPRGCIGVTNTLHIEFESRDSTES